MAKNNEHKLDPRLRRRAELHLQAVGVEKDRVPAFIEVATSDSMEWIKSRPWLKDFVQVVDGYCTATVMHDHLKELADYPGVIEVEAVRFFQPQLDHSVDSIRGWDRMSREDGLMQGAGVVIGIVDYGLDFTLDDFRDSKGNTRIQYLWDQRLKAQSPAEKPPKKYPYGVEYSADDINRALKTANPFAVVRHDPLEIDSDVSGHGTHVAGIAAGNGKTSDRDYPAGRYVGVAPGATLVFVHLNRRTMRAQVDTPRGTLANSVNLAHAIAYCFEKADELNMPCVVNLSMGFNGGGHDGNMAVEWIMDVLLQKSGRAVVIAAGNENRPSKGIYMRGSLRKDERVAIGWEHGFMLFTGRGTVAQGDPSPNEMEIWYSNKCELRVRLVAPREDQASGWVQPGDALAPFKFDGGEHAVITSDQCTAWDGAARIYIQLSKGKRGNGIRAGTWVVELEATEVGEADTPAGVRYDAWIERSLPENAPRYLRSRFKDYNATGAITVTTPGTARCVITVASCDSSDPAAISEFSGCGPTRDGRNKPDIAAPGESVTSTNASAGRGNPAAPARMQLQGTSMAAPHVTGVVARLLSRQHYLTWREIRDILVKTAVLPADAASPWDPEWGYGKVDAAAAMQRLEDKLR